MDSYRVRQIDAHTWQIEDLFHTFCYLIEGEEKAILFDSGNGFPGLPELIGSLTEKPVTVVLSHGHFDHTGCSALFGDCLIDERDIPVMKEGFDPATRREKMEFFMNLYHVKLDREQQEFFLSCREPEEGKIHYIHEGDVLNPGGRKLEVIAAPGHTRGSLVLLDAANHMLFGGDSLCNNEVLIYFDHSSSVEEFREGMEKVLGRRDEFRDIWPGHHDSPMTVRIVEEYLTAADTILKDPSVGKKVEMAEGYKLLYTFGTIGISYLPEHVYKA